MTRQDTVRRRTARTAGKNSSTLMQGQTRIQPDWQPSVTQMQSQSRICIIKYKKQGYSAQDAKKLANREIIHGEEATKKYIKDNNVKKSGPDYTATSPRDNVNTDWRTQERLNAQRNAVQIL